MIKVELDIATRALYCGLHIARIDTPPGYFCTNKKAIGCGQSFKKFATRLLHQKLMKK